MRLRNPCHIDHTMVSRTFIVRCGEIDQLHDPVSIALSLLLRQYKLAQLVKTGTAAEALQVCESSHDCGRALRHNESRGHDPHGAIDHRPHQTRGNDTCHERQSLRCVYQES